MKAIKKYVIILVVLTIVALLIYRLFNNKKQIDDELKAMSEYSSVIPVEIIFPKIQKTIQTIEENGVLRSDAEVAILSETSGKITFVSGNPGDKVTIGQTLVRVEKDVVESQFKLVKISLENAEKNLERYNNLAGGDAITKQQLEAAKLNYQNALTNYTTLKKQLENTDIKSPVTGIIAKRFVNEGDNLMPSMQVFSILEKNKMVFVVNMAESDIQWIKIEQKAIITFDIIPGKSYTGYVKDIGVIPDLSGRYEVVIRIVNIDSQFRAGLDGRAVFEHVPANSGVVIPRKCIVGSINDAGVFVINGDSVVYKDVEAISLNETDALITQGLSLNEKVVLSGQINLTDGVRVRVLNR